MIFVGSMIQKKMGEFVRDCEPLPGNALIGIDGDPCNSVAAK
jgi:hypothetical protein